MRHQGRLLTFLLLHRSSKNNGCVATLRLANSSWNDPSCCFFLYGFLVSPSKERVFNYLLPPGQADSVKGWGALNLCLTIVVINNVYTFSFTLKKGIVNDKTNNTKQNYDT